MTSIHFRNADLNDVSRCFQIESDAYEGDEAATFEKIRTRVNKYSEGFLILEVGSEIVGFINSGCASDVVMSDENIKELIGHSSDAPNVVIMSVVVSPKHQGKGYSILMMEQFVERMKLLNKKSIQLMCKQVHIELYLRMGYSYLKPSASEHGGMAWHEMVMTFE